MPAPRHRFPKGNKLAKGGKREGSGRKPDWFKRFCEEELAKDEAKALRLIGKIARGEAKFERGFANDGRVTIVQIGGSASDIISAGEFLRDSSVGKAPTTVDHQSTGNKTFSIVIQGMDDVNDDA